MLRLYQHFAEDNIEIRWVHSEANVADCMTKTGARGIWEAFMKECKWSTVKDCECTSTRNRKMSGIKDRLGSNIMGIWRDILEERFGKERMKAIEKGKNGETGKEVYQEYCRQKNKGGGKENAGEKRDDREEEGRQEGRVIKELVYTAIRTYLLL